ncbi:MAG: response regulator [Bacteroidetes bacterium]|jgi:signal transduction histidine kinase/CheY-like chemotaxis protein/HAMP domain-containing protein|nr:response regulator [Bacteroidota bacterium]
MFRSRVYLRVLGNFGFLLIVLVVMTLLITRVLNQMQSSYASASADIAFLSSLTNLRTSVGETPDYLELYLSTKDPGARDAYISGAKAVDEAFTDLRGHAADSLTASYVDQARSLFRAWQEYVVQPKVRLAEEKLSVDSVATLTAMHREAELNGRYLFQMRSILTTLVQRQLSSQSIQMEGARTLSAGLEQFIVFVNVLFALFAVALGFFLTRSITRPLNQLREGTQNIMDSKFVPLDVQRSDEFGELASDFNTMSTMLRENYTRIRSYSDLMTVLNENESTSGVLSKSLDLLCQQVQAINGAFYLFDRETNRLSLRGSFALRADRTAIASFAIGEGIPGECARLRQGLEVNDLPQLVSFPVDTGLNTITPKTAYAVPVMFQENLVGVLVLGATKPFDEFTKALISSAAPQIGVAITNALNFESTQALSQELTSKHAELNAKNAELERAYQVKSDFLSNMSHELRTPLNSIIGFTSILLSDRGDPMTADQRKAMEKVLKNGKHLLQLINDILDFSKIESGRMHLSVETDSVESVVNGAILTAEHLVRQKGLELKEEIQPGLPMLQTDTLKVKQIIVNLLSNASKFTDQGAIEVKAWLDQGMVHVSVKDSGIGIESKDIDRIFEEFQQIDSSHSRKYKGTGLGLPIARRLARLLGGDLVATSAHGHGSTFTLTVPPELPKSVSERAEVTQRPIVLPASASTPGAVAPPPRPPAAATPPAPPKPAVPPPPVIPKAADGQTKILCIDDEPDVIDILRNYLVPEGYAVYAAYGGADGLKVAEEVNPHVITLDIMMPEKDGWQVLRELKANPKTRDIPVLIHSMIDNKPLAFSLGALDYLPKPADSGLVLKLVSKAVKTKDKHLLLIDDDHEYRAVLRGVLGQAGFSVEEAESGKEAMERLRNARPALILLDLRMPDMDGFELLRHLREVDAWKSIPVIILTGADLTPQQVTEMNRQMIDYVRKSDLTVESITQSIKRVL